MACSRNVSLQSFRWWVGAAFIIVVFAVGYLLLSRVVGKTSTTDDATQAWLSFLFAMGLPIGAYIIANVRIAKSRKQVSCLQAVIWFIMLVAFCGATVYMEYSMLYSTKDIMEYMDGFKPKTVSVLYTVKEATDFVCGWFGPILTALLFVDVFASPLEKK